MVPIVGDKINHILAMFAKLFRVHTSTYFKTILARTLVAAKTLNERLIVVSLSERARRCTLYITFSACDKVPYGLFEQTAITINYRSAHQQIRAHDPRAYICPLRDQRHPCYCYLYRNWSALVIVALGVGCLLTDHNTVCDII